MAISTADFKNGMCIINNGKKEPEDVRPSVAEQLHTPCKPGQHKPAHPSRGESR